MQSQESLIGDNLEFLQPYKVDSEVLSLSSDDQVSIQKYFLTFDPWKGISIPNTYNGKAVIDWSGEPLFAELAILRLFQSHGWDGVWVDSYRRKYRVGLPDVVDPISLPNEKQLLVNALKKRTGRSGGCWDVLVWKGDVTLFLELKRQKKDAVQNTQIEWLEASLAHGLKPENFALLEWKLASSKLEFEDPEDRKFFADLLVGGDEARLEREFSNRFDFRHPAIKREEFNKIRKQVLKNLLQKYGKACQLRLHQDCSKVAVWEPDHIIPLSTNELNKKLRHMLRTGTEKVLRQSFGSNHPDNLTLACKRCNAFKKHRLLMLG